MSLYRKAPSKSATQTQTQTRTQTQTQTQNYPQQQKPATGNNKDQTRSSKFDTSDSDGDFGNAYYSDDDGDDDDDDDDDNDDNDDSTRHNQRLHPHRGSKTKPNVNREFQNQLKEHERFDQHGNELFVADVERYQTEGIVVSIRVRYRGANKKKTKTMVVRFTPPRNAPEDFIVPDLTVKETEQDTIYTIENAIQQGDYVYFEPSQARWYRDREKSLVLAEERAAEDLAQGKAKIKRVVLNTERMLGPTGIPSLYYEIPAMASENFKNAQVTTIGDKTKQSDSIMKKNAMETKSLLSSVTVNHTRSPTALSIPNSLHNLNTMLSGVYLWKQQLLPKVQTNEFIRRLLSLGADKHIQIELDRFMMMSFDNDIVPRLDVRDNRLDHRHDFLAKSRQDAINPDLIQRRKELLEHQRLHQHAQLELAKLKNDDYKRKEQEKVLEAAAKELKRKERELEKLNRATQPRGSKKKSNRRSDRWNSDESESDTDSDSNSDDVDDDNIIDNNSISYQSTPRRGVTTRSRVTTPTPARKRQYTNTFYDSDDYDDDHDDEITLKIQGVPVSATSATSAASQHPLQNHHLSTQIKRLVIDDDDSEDEYYNFLATSREKRRTEMADTSDTALHQKVVTLQSRSNGMNGSDDQD